MVVYLTVTFYLKGDGTAQPPQIGKYFMKTVRDNLITRVIR